MPRALVVGPGAILCLVFGSMTGCSAGDQSLEPRASRVQSTFSLTPPYSVVEVDTYLDGGSSAWTIRGANRKQLRFTFDLGIRGEPESRGGPRLAYFGKLRNPADAVPFRSARESTLVDLLEMCAEQHLAKSVLVEADSCRRLGDLNRFMRLRNELDKTQQFDLDAYCLARGMREQEARGYWRTTNDRNQEPLPDDTVLSVR